MWYALITKFLLIVMSIIFVIDVIISDTYYTMYRSLDWYEPKVVDAYNFMNQTYFHILEAIVLLLCYIKHRHYPKEFNITQEILWATLLNYLFNNHFEYLTMVDGGRDNGCVFGLIHFSALSDCVKALGFVIVLWYLTNKSDNYFPLPFTWIFKDLSKFIFEQNCLRVFRDYLMKKEPQEVVHLDRIMRIYLQTTISNIGERDSIGKERNSTVGTYLLNTSETTAKQQLVDSLNKLRPSFSRFKKTVSFTALYQRVKEYEEISQKIYM